MQYIALNIFTDKKYLIYKSVKKDQEEW